MKLLLVLKGKLFWKRNKKKKIFYNWLMHRGRWNRTGRIQKHRDNWLWILANSVGNEERVTII